MPAPKGHAPYPGCETGGRPTKYTDEFLEKEAEELMEWMKKKENLFFEDFAYERGYSSRRILEFVKKNEKFSLAYERLSDRQKTTLMKGGLSKKLAHPMCALLLGHAHGIVAKTEQKISGDAANPLAVIFEQTDGKTKELVNDQSE